MQTSALPCPIHRPQLWFWTKYSATAAASTVISHPRKSPTRGVRNRPSAMKLDQHWRTLIPTVDLHWRGQNGRPSRGIAVGCSALLCSALNRVRRRCFNQHKCLYGDCNMTVKNIEIRPTVYQYTSKMDRRIHLLLFQVPGWVHPYLKQYIKPSPALEE